MVMMPSKIPIILEYIPIHIIPFASGKVPANQNSTDTANDAKNNDKNPEKNPPNRVLSILSNGLVSRNT